MDTVWGGGGGGGGWTQYDPDSVSKQNSSPYKLFTLESSEIQLKEECLKIQRRGLTQKEENLYRKKITQKEIDRRQFHKKSEDTNNKERTLTKWFFYKKEPCRKKRTSAGRRGL